MRKIIAVVAVLSLALCVINVAPYAASADIAVRVGKTTYMQDDEFTAEIYFPKSYNKIAALDMSLSYDTTKLEIVKVTPGKGLRKARYSRRITISQERLTGVFRAEITTYFQMILLRLRLRLSRLLSMAAVILN